MKNKQLEVFIRTAEDSKVIKKEKQANIKKLLSKEQFNAFYMNCVKTKEEIK